MQGIGVEITPSISSRAHCAGESHGQACVIKLRHDCSPLPSPLAVRQTGLDKTKWRQSRLDERLDEPESALNAIRINRIEWKECTRPVSPSIYPSISGAN